MIKKMSAMLVLLCLTAGSLPGQETCDVKRVLALQEGLTVNGVTGLLAVAKANQWRAPLIPSQWHVVHVAGTNAIPCYQAARQFGASLVAALVETEDSVLHAPIDEALRARVVNVFDLADWCGSTEGYGNLFLARKCLDVAALGVSRLATQMTCPTNALCTLTNRLNGVWMKPETRMRVLNAEAGATLFTGSREEDIRNVAGSGGLALFRKHFPDQTNETGWLRGFRGKAPLETAVINEHAEFFVDEDVSTNGEPLASMWNRKSHQPLMAPMEPQSVRDALVLVRFRVRIGHFPTNDVPGALCPGAEGAFTEAWVATAPYKPGLTFLEDTSEMNIGWLAWQVYDRVQRGQLMPSF